MAFECENCGRVSEYPDTAAEGCEHTGCGFLVGRFHYVAASWESPVDPSPPPLPPDPPVDRDPVRFGPMIFALGLLTFFIFAATGGSVLKSGNDGLMILSIVGLIGSAFAVLVGLVMSFLAAIK